MNPRPATLAARIRWVIEALGITQGAFAARANMAPSQLSVLLKRLDEKPHAVELETVVRLAEAGEVSYRWLLLGEGEPHQQGAISDRPLYPPLRKNHAFGKHLHQLMRDGRLMDTDLANWIGEVSLPLKNPAELTPEVLLSLARMRLQMLYGSIVEPREYSPISPLRKERPSVGPATVALPRQAPLPVKRRPVKR